MKFQSSENRREFIKYLTALTAGIVIPISVSGNNSEQHDRLGKVLPKRMLGKTGLEVTMLGVGGYHIGWTSEKDAQEVIEAALEGGIRFFDSAESYGPHTSEIRYGKYLVPHFRDDIFLMTKTYSTSPEQARKHLEESLDRMKTDHLDLWQLHSLESQKDVEDRITEGILEVMMEAKESGKTRHIGFTGHADPRAHARMLERTRDNPLFETIQMPVNVVDYNYKYSFIKQVLPLALEGNMGVLAMKTLADGRFFADKRMGDEHVWSSDDPVVPGRLSMRDALYFAWSLPISVLITGAENAKFIKEKIELAKGFASLSEEEQLALVAKVVDLAEKGEVEYYKNV